MFIIRVGIATALLLTSTLVWAESADDRVACQQELSNQRQERTFYEIHLAEMLVEVRAQLQTVRQELVRLKAAKPEKK